MFVQDFDIKQVCITININGHSHSPKLLQMDVRWSFIDFLNAASNKLEMIPSARRVFNAYGKTFFLFRYINTSIFTDDDT